MLDSEVDGWFLVQPDTAWGRVHQEVVLAKQLSSLPLLITWMSPGKNWLVTMVRGVTTYPIGSFTMVISQL